MCSPCKGAGGDIECVRISILFRVSITDKHIAMALPDRVQRKLVNQGYRLSDDIAICQNRHIERTVTPAS